MANYHVYYQNVNGLRTKLQELCLSLSSCIHDVLVLTETNLQPHISSGELGFPDSYIVFRRDRSLDATGKSGGGGVLIAASKHVNPTEIIMQTQLELICVSLAPRPHCRTLLVGAYIPPDSNLRTYLEFSHKIEEVLSVSHFGTVHLLGDFNVPVQSWINLDLPSVLSPLSILSQTAAMFSLSQVNEVRNQRGVLLDLIFTSASDAEVLRDSDPIVPEDMHHPALNLSIALPASTNPKPRYMKNLVRCDLDKVYSDLSEVKFDIMDYNVHSSFEHFIFTIRDLVAKYSPLKRCGISKFPKWFSPQLRQLVILKKALHKRYKQALDGSTYQDFSLVRSQCKAVSRECFANYVNHVQGVLAQNPKVFWSYVKALQGSNSLPSTVHFEGSTSVDDESSSNLFADFFSTVFGERDEELDPLLSAPPSCLGLSSVSPVGVTEVLQVLSSLDVNKGCGPDSIPPAAVKHCRHLLAPPLTRLFNLSLSTGTFPDILKNSYIVPIHKKGPINDVKNYRPIAILSVFAKVFERVVLSRIGHVVNHFITPSQHGFRRGRSSATNLIAFEMDVFDAFEDRCQVDVVELDFAKAFDRVNHSLLLNKLQLCDIRGSLLRWIASYLRDRGLQVRYNGAVSRKFMATSGVPQGSLLGPLLFSIFVNDVVADLSCGFQLFADDLKIYQRVSSVNDSEVLQHCIDLVSQWCLRNKMSLNVDKCTCITFHRISNPLRHEYLLDGGVLTRLDVVKDLGVVLASDLSWERQVQAVCSRALRNLGLIHRTAATFTNLDSLRLLYCSLVRPHLEYCDVAWSPHQTYLKEELESVQRRFLRSVGTRLGFRYLNVPLEEISSMLRLPSLEVRRINHDIIFLQRLVAGEVDCPDLLSRINFRIPTGTRSRDLFARVSATSNYQQNNPIQRIQRHGNLLPDSMDPFSCSGSVFKRRLGHPSTYQFPAGQP